MQIWNFEQASSFVDPYEQRLKTLQLSKKASMPSWAKQNSNENSEAKAEDKPAAPEVPSRGASAPVVPTAGGTYTLEQLQGKIASIDPTKKEEYLSDSDFQEVFGMSKTAFGALPKWKRNAAKKKHGLF